VQDIIEKPIVTRLFKNLLLSLWNLKVHYSVRKTTPLDPIVGQPNPVRPTESYLSKFQLIVILPPKTWSSQWSPNFGHPARNPVNTSPLSCACHMSRPTHPPWLNRPNNIRWRIEVTQFIIMQFSSPSVFVHFRFKYYLLHSVLENPQYMFLLQSERPSFAPIEYN
jgi:hypothetical protein